MKEKSLIYYFTFGYDVPISWRPYFVSIQSPKNEFIGITQQHTVFGVLNIKLHTRNRSDGGSLVSDRGFILLCRAGREGGIAG